MRKIYFIIIKILLVIIGWFFIQNLFASIPFDKEDLTLNYYLTKVFIQSLYVMFSLNLIGTSLNIFVRQDSK